MMKIVVSSQTLTSVLWIHRSLQTTPETSRPGALSTSGQCRLGDRHYQPLGRGKLLKQNVSVPLLFTLYWQEPGHLVLISYFRVTIHPQKFSGFKQQSFYPLHYSIIWQLRLDSAR